MKIESTTFTRSDVEQFLAEMLDHDRHSLAGRLETASARLAEIGPRVKAGRGDGEWSDHELLAHIAVLSKFYGVLVHKISSGQMTELDLLENVNLRDVVGEQMALFVPLSMQPQIVRGRHWRNSGNASWLSLIGRLKSGITPAQAEANLNVVFQHAVRGGYGALLSTDDKNAIRETRMNIHISSGGGGVSALRGDYRVPLLLLMGIVGLVLLIACVNVANLLLARASIRNKEIAIRLAIGARGSDVLTQFLVESIIMGVLGGAIGLALGVAGAKVLGHFTGWETVISPIVMLIAIGFSGAVGVFFGYYPARKAAALNPIQALRYE